MVLADSHLLECARHLWGWRVPVDPTLLAVGHNSCWNCPCGELTKLSALATQWVFN